MDTRVSSLRRRTMPSTSPLAHYDTTIIYPDHKHSMAPITLTHIMKQYGGADAAPAIRNLNLTIEAGEFTVLLGPSGCGKSTTLRMIAGLDSPTSGRILIGGHDVTDLPPAKRRIAMVFQSYALFPHLSVRENILFGLKVRREPAHEHPARLDRVATLLGLQTLLDRKPAQLSGGQQQRVALGRAVISNAPVCLMDEPLSNLDAQLRHEMRREIRSLQQELGVTMVYVTHDQTEAMSMADRVVLLRNGEIEQHDTPDALYARPATTFSARFIGTPPMNILDLDGAGGTVRIAGTSGPALSNAPAHAVQLGVRPEHVSVTPQGPVAATIQNVEYFGADSILVCKIGSNSGFAVRVPGHLHAQPGHTIGLAWHADQQHFFDADARRIHP